MTGNGKLLVWIAVALGAAAGVAVTVVLLRGDPTYLVQARTRAGAPYGAPAPVNFAFRAFSATVLAAGLIAAGGRAVSEEALPLWPATLAGYALFVLAVIVSAAVGPAFPMFLIVVWFAPLLAVIVYSEAIADLLRGPPWLLWGFCLLALAARVLWLAFVTARV